jgi:hypothetical protein
MWQSRKNRDQLRIFKAFLRRMKGDGQPPGQRPREADTDERVGLQYGIKIAFAEREQFARCIQHRVKLLSFAREHRKFANRVAAAEKGHHFLFTACVGCDPDAAGADQIKAIHRVAFTHQDCALLMVNDLEQVGELAEDFFAERAEYLIALQEVEALISDLRIKRHRLCIILGDEF